MRDIKKTFRCIVPVKTAAEARKNNASSCVRIVRQKIDIIVLLQLFDAIDCTQTLTSETVTSSRLTFTRLIVR